jgi:hypothetical protein
MSKNQFPAWDALSFSIINNYLTFVNENGLISARIILVEKHTASFLSIS